MKSAILAIIAGFSLAACASGPATPDEAARSPDAIGPNAHASKRLLAKGIDPSFLDFVRKHYREDQRKSVLELNFLGFLRSGKKETVSDTIPRWEIERVRKFVKNNQAALREAEKKFKVPKEVIASLLWVETKHGKDLGTFHVSSALFSLAMADFPTIFDQLVETARQKSDDFDKAREARLQERARRRSEWAADELIALQEIHKKGWKKVAKLNGSFSGAFGMAQFIPSSYLSWAKSRKAKKPNLFRAEDSIISVANYLHSNGWLPKDREAQESALFHYNNDRSYVTHILRMSECLRAPEKTKRPKRNTASARSC